MKSRPWSSREHSASLQPGPDSPILQTPTFIFASALCLISAIGLARVYDVAPPQAIGLTIVGGAIFILALSKFNQTFRTELESVSTERLICWHAIRGPIGAAFLVMAGEGLLPDLFAERAGYGDLFVAFSGVLGVLLFASLGKQKTKRTFYLIWNLAGLADLMTAVGTGIYMALQVPDSMVWLARLPLLLVPTFILPVLFATHFIMLKRLLWPLDSDEIASAEFPTADV